MAYRDPELGAWLRERRAEVGLAVSEITTAAWHQLGVPLHAVSLEMAERGQRQPSAWHVDALIALLGLTDEQARWFIQRWAANPKVKTQPSWDTWEEYLTDQPLPLPVMRRSTRGPIGAVRMARLDNPVELNTQLKLRTNAEEDALLRLTARTLDYTVSDYVRAVIQDALNRSYEHQQRSEPGEHARTVAHNIRIRLTPAELRTFRELGRGLKLSTWAYFVVMDYLRGADLSAQLASSRRLGGANQ